MLATDPTHGTQNVALFNKWLVKHADLALDASNRLQPIWSQPRVKVASFSDALAHAKNRIKGIATELGLKVPANLSS
jgi:propane monooxygenase small subunit